MKFKTQLLKKIDSLIGRPAIYLSKVVRPRKSKLFSESGLTTLEPEKCNILKILVIRPGGIGDAVLLFPALKVLKDKYPDSQIDILVEKRNHGVFECCDYIDNIILYDNKPVESLSHIFREKYEIVIDTEQWHRLTSVISYLTRSPIRVGFNTNDRSKLFTHKVDYSHEDYEVRSFLNLISGLTKKKYDFNPNGAFISVDKDKSPQLVREIKEYRKRWDKIVGIFSGATVIERTWGVENFSKVAHKLIERRIGIVIVGGKNELQDSEKIENSVESNKILNLTAKTSLYETALVISNLDLFLSADTGLMHIAYGVGTPTVSLFGAGIQKKWGPKGKNNIMINKYLPCSPCTKFGYTPTCKIQVKCLKDIDCNEIVNAIENLIT